MEKRLSPESSQSAASASKTSSRRRFLTATGAVTLTAVAGCLGGSESPAEGDEGGGEAAFDPVTVDIPPTATYLRTNNDAAGETAPLALSEQPFGPGDRITLERLGEFDNGSPSGTAGLGMHAVFSTSSELLGSDQIERVSGAIDVGPYHQTTATYYGGLWTSIREDFLVSNNEGSQTSVTVDVPEEATHLFVAAKDNLYEDNSVAGDQFAVRISDGTGEEPATGEGDAPEEIPPPGTPGGGDGDGGSDGEGDGEATIDPDATIPLEPTATYLQTNGDNAGDATPITLSEYDISPGDDVTLSILGSYNNGGGDSRVETVAVFSSSSELASADNLERVTGAIDAGVDFETAPTFNGGVETDIPEDFAVAEDDGYRSVTVGVPEEVTHLFVAPSDNLLQDNSSNEYRLGLTTY